MNIWFDVTTTLSWKRPALGVVRVEAEAARYYLNTLPYSVKFCCFDYSVGSYFEVKREEISAALMRLDTGEYLSSPLPHHPGLKVEGSSQLQCTLPRGFIQPFNTGDIYISLGLDWDQKNLVFLYALKKHLQLQVVLFCYDIIPIIMPEHCVSGVPEKFPEYFVNAAW
ncbi:MAG TPA: hypothetical protein PLK94_04520, partial [Alphaproteobacteria bacterium]|nr:hypothetical protein [Alphaproteobacteria bacterium]